MSRPARIFGTRVESGVRSRHLITFYGAAFATILFAVLINALQPFLLTTVLNIPLHEQGQVSAQAAFIGEIVLVVLIGVFGVLSDRVGRRIVYGLGFFVVGLGFLISPWTLLLGRAVYAVGIAAATAMLSTIAADYVINRDRGKANAIMGIMNGLGAVAAALGLAKLPHLFQSLGQDGPTAAKTTFAVIAGLSLLVAVWMLWGLKRKDQTQHAQDEHQLNFFRMVKEGWAEARKNSSIALCYAAAFVARADLAVAGVFFPLWLSKHFSERIDPQLVDMERMRALDLATAAGVASGGKLVAIIGAAALLFAPIVGILCDRWNRFHVLLLTLLINVVGYGLTWMIKDPTQGTMAFICLIIGCGQVGAVIASQVLVQQFAPEAKRGTIVGTFGSFGALGIMVTLLTGGWLFDRWMEAGPFIFLAFCNLALAVFVFGFTRRKTASAELLSPLYSTKTSQ